MQSVDPAILSEFVDACPRVGHRGLVQCSSGNLSCRIGEDRMLVTANRTWLENIRDDQVAMCRLSDAAPLTDVKPSVEAMFHAGILRLRSNMNVVLHFQSPFASTLACRSPETIDFAMLPEIPYYIGTVGVVPYFTPGSTELAQAVIEAHKTNDMVVLKNHGLVTVGVDYDDAIQKAVFFELSCRVIVQGGDGIHSLPSEGADILRQKRNTGGAVENTIVSSR